MSLSLKVFHKQPLATLDRHRHHRREPCELIAELSQTSDAMGNTSLELLHTARIDDAQLVMFSAPVDAGERRPSGLGLHGSALLRIGRSWPNHPGRSSRCSKHNSCWPVRGWPPPGGTGLPLDLNGHAAKILSRRRR